MASRSPEADPADGPGANEYMLGWAALTRLMLDGHSWSGHERNCAYVNLGQGRFADASFASGLDFADDGDLDLWLKNRTGPQLRFLRNEHAEEQGRPDAVMLRLVGKTANRDAIGARVDLVIGGRKLRRDVVSGDGYLAQSTRWLHFGLGDSKATGIDQVVVHWPGGKQETIDGVVPGRRYTIEQGSGRAVASAAPASGSVSPASASSSPASLPGRVLLKVPLPLPPTLSRPLYGKTPPKKATLINLWAQWCEPCFTELGEFADRYAELQSAGLDIVALSVDPPADREQATIRFAERIGPRMTGSRFSSRPVTDELTEVIDALLQHVLHRHGELTLPTSLLVDRQGRVQMIYLGAISVDQLLEDTRRWALDDSVPAYLRSLYGGRWYFRTPRGLHALAEDLKTRGLGDDGQFYYAVQRMSEMNRQQR